MDDKQIGGWSIKKFGGTSRQQYKKYLEEYKEMLFELADMWIVICGLKARGTTMKFPDYDGFCKQYSVDPKRLRSIINIKMMKIKKAIYKEINGVQKRMKSAEEIKEIMLKLAEERGVTPSSSMDKIANFRARQNIPISICPCSPNDKERGCVSDKCYKEILENGTCHCKAFIRQGIDTTDLK